MNELPEFYATPYERRTRTPVTANTGSITVKVSSIATLRCSMRQTSVATRTLNAALCMVACSTKPDAGATPGHQAPDAAYSRAAIDAGTSPSNPEPNDPSPNDNEAGSAQESVEAPSHSTASLPDFSSAPLATEVTVPTTAQRPDGALGIPARIEAEAFTRFNETDAPMDESECGDGRVDMGHTDDNDGECYVGWTQGGEWLEYDIWSSEANVYSLTLRLASGDAGREVTVFLDGQEIGNVYAPGRGWTQFEDVVLEHMNIAAGSHVIRLGFASGQTNFNYMVFEAEASTTPALGATSDVPAHTSGAADSNVPDDTMGNRESCAAVPSGYALVWSDEFDYEGLPDPERWGYEVGGEGWGNNELQYYTDARRDNAKVSAGLLTITAIAEAYEGNEYTSAKLNSAFGACNPGAWNQGIVRVRARLPAGLGTWPALWMMPNNCTEGWPACGEIDVMEHVGYDEGTVHGTIHTDAFNHVEGTQKGKAVLVEDATSAFHDYTLIWEAERMQWLVDGEVYYTIEKEAEWGFAEWPFDEKSWHLKMNLAVGGEWGGTEGVNRDDFPTQFEIDHVCVYQTQ